MLLIILLHLFCKIICLQSEVCTLNIDQLLFNHDQPNKYPSLNDRSYVSCNNDVYIWDVDIWKFDTQTLTWTELIVCTDPYHIRVYNALECVDGIIYSHGGTTQSEDYISELWSYNISSGICTQLSNGPGRVDHKIIHVDGKLYTHGGRYTIEAVNSRTKELWYYDIGLDTWTQLIDGPHGPDDYAVTYMNGCLYFHGGKSLIHPSTGHNENTLYKYCILSTSWEVLQSTKGSKKHALFPFLNELYMFGTNEHENNTFHYTGNVVRKYDFHIQDWVFGMYGLHGRVNFGFTSNIKDEEYFIIGGIIKIDQQQVYEVWKIVGDCKECNICEECQEPEEICYTPILYYTPENCGQQLCDDLATLKLPNTQLQATVCESCDEQYLYEAFLPNEIEFKCYATVAIWVDPKVNMKMKIFDVDLKFISTDYQKIPHQYVYRFDKCTYNTSLTTISLYFDGMIKYIYNLEVDFSTDYIVELDNYNYKVIHYSVAVWDEYLTNNQIKDLFVIGHQILPGEYCRNEDNYEHDEDIIELANHIITKKRCYGVAYNEEDRVCNGHGTCKYNDFCICNYGYFGLMCENVRDPIWIGWYIV